ncbi:MAG: radical SAM protein [Patescibacteria group bacterium]
MISKQKNNDWRLIRIIVPASKRETIYSRPLKITTSLAAVILATIINKIWGWRVEIIDENNFRSGPLDKNGLPDHAVLQRENPAVLVGFYCGLSSQIDRVWDLAKLYKEQGVATVAGSWHSHYLPEETLRHDIDLVVHGDGEPVIKRIISNFSDGKPLWQSVPGVSFLRDGKVYHNSLSLQEIQGIPDEDEFLNGLMNKAFDLSDQPYPDFGLVKLAKIKIYPIGRIRGCSFRCEFCSVRGSARWASPEYLFGTVNWLVQTRKAKEFFIVDDRLEEDIEGTIRFFEMIAKKYGNKLSFIVQVRLGAAENTRLLEVMEKAGVRVVCIGYESPIQEELKAMRKGVAAEKMLELTRIWRKHFRIHGMFIVGFPLQDNQPSPPAKKIYKVYKDFVRKAGIDSVQFLVAGPVPGSDLKKRLKKDQRLPFSDQEMSLAGDGNFVLFKPIGITATELQNTTMRLMRWFYGPLNIPRFVFRLLSFPFDWLIRGWQNWYKDWCRDKIKLGGHYLLRKWQRRKEVAELLEEIKKRC